MVYNRKEIIGNATLYLGDCFDIVPSLVGIDAIITDPPFNAGKKFKNDNMTKDEWKHFCERVTEMFAATDAINTLVEVGKNDTTMRSALDARLQYRWAIILNYTNSMRNGACGYSNFGLVLWYGNKCFKRYMDRIDAPLENTLSKFSHPSPKTTAHYTHLVRMFSPLTGTVLDPFMGSGTTSIACTSLGRKFIGIEIEPKYFDMACERTNEAKKSVIVKHSFWK